MLCPLRLKVDPIVMGSPWLISEGLIKQHSRIDDADSDDVLEVYLKAAILWAENTTHRTIFARAHQWVLRDFPHSHRMEIRLPRGKVQSVDGISYVSGGQVLNLAGPSAGSPGGSDYQEDLSGSDGGSLMPPQGGSWPSVDYDVPAPVTVSFTAGWLAGEVPADIVHAILFAVEDMFDVRGTPDFSPAMVSADGPRFATREALISPYRLTRWYA